MADEAPRETTIGDLVAGIEAAKRKVLELAERRLAPNGLQERLHKRLEETGEAERDPEVVELRRQIAELQREAYGAQLVLRAARATSADPLGNIIKAE
jgi:hypothetical protein